MKITATNLTIVQNCKCLFFIWVPQLFLHKQVESKVDMKLMFGREQGERVDQQNLRPQFGLLNSNQHHCDLSEEWY